MSLYTKHRPSTLNEMYGNKTLIKNLKNYFKRDVHNHCHLFYGASGCGKTTVARAIANDILGATEMSITEINAASDNGIDMTRQLQDACLYPPTIGEHSVFIIDECHMLTGAAKGSLLKTCEDVPDWVYIFFCTTNRDAFLKGSKGETTNALSTRCSQWKLEALNQNDALTLLDKVINEEHYQISDQVFYEIEKVSEGSPRLLLVNLEKVSDPNLTDEERLEMLKTSKFESANEEVSNLFKLLLNKASMKEIGAVIKQIKPSEEPVSLSKAVMSYMSAILLNGFNPQAASVLQCFARHAENGGIINEGWPVFVLACLESIN